MAPEGELKIAVRVARGRVAATRVESTRPDVGAALLQGRSAAEITAAVPQLFAVCAASQQAAADLACAAAQGQAAGDAALRSASAAAGREALAEAARCVLLQWPQWLDEPPAGEALAAARAAHAWRNESKPGLHEEEGVAAAASAAVARATFAMPAEEWLAIDTPLGLQRWADAGQTAPARFVAKLLAQAARTHARPAVTVPLLPATTLARRLPALAAAIEADPAFAQRPVWQGAPAETGPLARLQRDELVAALLRGGCPRTPLRWVARLRELALLCCGRARMAAGVHPLPGGAAVAWVENARGLLLHLARIGPDGRAAVYRIVAPTEWNFHPAGALPLALAGVPAPDAAAVEARVTAVARSLDPCVGWRLEVEGA